MEKPLVFISGQFVSSALNEDRLLNLSLVSDYPYDDKVTELYLEFNQPMEVIDAWTKAYIVPYLEGNTVTEDEAREFIKNFISNIYGSEKPIFLYDASQFNWNSILNLFDGMELPFFHIPIELSSILFKMNIDMDIDRIKLIRNLGISIDEDSIYNSLYSAHLLMSLYDNLTFREKAEQDNEAHHINFICGLYGKEALSLTEDSVIDYINDNMDYCNFLLCQCLRHNTIIPVHKVMHTFDYYASKSTKNKYIDYILKQYRNPKTIKRNVFRDISKEQDRIQLEDKLLPTCIVRHEDILYSAHRIEYYIEYLTYFEDFFQRNNYWFNYIVERLYTLGESGDSLSLLYNFFYDNERPNLPIDWNRIESMLDSYDRATDPVYQPVDNYTSMFERVYIHHK